MGIGDFVQSVGVFSAALIMYFKPEWRIVDPICTFIFSVLVLGTTISILRNTMNVLMEGIPQNVNFSVAKDTFLRVPGIVTVHNLRIWGLTTDKTALSAHLVIDPSRNAQDILKEAWGTKGFVKKSATDGFSAKAAETVCRSLRTAVCS